MLVQSKNKSQWDLQNEISKTVVRWVLILTVGLYFVWQLSQERHEMGILNSLNVSFVSLLLVISIIVNTAYHFFLVSNKKRERRISTKFKYLSMTYDLAMLSVILLPTGGSNSMFFLIYFIIILSNGIRYGMRLSLAGSILFNSFYVAILYLEFYPDLNIPDFQKEVLKIVGVWFIGIYTGYLSHRFEILHDQVEKYKEIVQKLMAELPDGKK